MTNLFQFIYRKSENDAVNRFFAPYFEVKPSFNLSWVNANDWVLVGDVPDPWDMTDEGRDEFIREARDTFVNSLWIDHSTLEISMGEAFASALNDAIDRRLRDGIADDGTMHTTPSESDISDYERALEKALEQFEEEATVHFNEVELPEMREQFEEDFRSEWEARTS